MTRCAAPGITPASACAPARRCARRRSMRSPAGRWSGRAIGVFVREKLAARAGAAGRAGEAPDSIVIVGGGAAGLAAADMLRREGYDGPLTMISADDSPPCDRPNLSKDYLAGTAQEEWIPLRPESWYDERRIDLLLNSRVSRRSTCATSGSTLEGGGSRGYALAAACDGCRSGATGDPRCRDGPGALSPHLRRQQGDRGPRRPRRNAWSWWAPASSGSRWRHRSVRGTSRCMSWRPKASRSSGSWDRRWARSSGGCTRVTA